MRWFLGYAAGCVLLLTPALRGEAMGQLRVQFSVGLRAPNAEPFYLKLLAAGGVQVHGESEWSGTAGMGRVETRSVTLAYGNLEIKPIQNLQMLWADLIAHSDPDTIRRLTQDPAWRNDSRRLTIEMNPEGTRGFTLTVDQLLQNKAFWVPSLDLYVAAGESPVPFAGYRSELDAFHDARVLDRVQGGPEATYEEYKSLWEDMGSPDYVHPSQQPPGHVVCLTWGGAIAKFGIDRGAGVWNDFGNPDRFRFRYAFGDLTEGLGRYWKGQSLEDGLPIIATVIERSGVRYEVEQFAYPLHGPPEQRSGELSMVLMQRVKLTNVSGAARTVPVTITHERRFSPQSTAGVVTIERNHRLLLLDEAHHNALLTVDSGGTEVKWAQLKESMQQMKRMDMTVFVSLPAGGLREVFITLPSAPVAPGDQPALLDLDYNAARTRTREFWSVAIARGAQFQVPELAVNDLFRASLWHALRLPRRHAEGDIDLPYSNFGYDQTGTPWPINQAVYVDYMLYGLRGYSNIATEELDAIYRNNQEASGRIGGFANWLAYTPGMLYAVAQNYLLSGDQASFDHLLPPTLKALDFTLDQLLASSGASGSAAGLVMGPLNDLTGNGYWAFNQAYLYAGLEVFGKALERRGHPRAQECLNAARAFRSIVERGFRIAAVHSPLVQLRDHTWVPYVPCEAVSYGRILEQWYPTDVDTGAMHLLRLKALPSGSDLADDLLNDHEDNLYLNGWGIANEPVYNPQATAYLLRDDVKAAIRSFYSYMASAFSHGVLEPVEHRWRWPQVFGPPSTDGAWFELYRNMLVRETDDGSLLLAQATPRRWLADGKRISVKDAPTWFGNVSFELTSHAGRGSISAVVRLDGRYPPQAILLRLRHPDGKRLRQVRVNGQDWHDFDAGKEWIRLAGSENRTWSLTAIY